MGGPARAKHLSALGPRRAKVADRWLFTVLAALSAKLFSHRIGRSVLGCGPVDPWARARHPVGQSVRHSGAPSASQGQATERKNAVLEPVYRTIRPPGWGLRVWQAAASKQPLAPQGPGRAPQPKGSRNGNKMVRHYPGDGFLQLSRARPFFRSDPHRPEIAI